MSSQVTGSATSSECSDTASCSTLHPVDGCISALDLDVIVTSLDDLPASFGVTSPDDVTLAARRRVERLARQCPPHDNDVRYCRSVRGDSEERELKDFVDKRQRDAIGRGRVCSVIMTSSSTALNCQQCCDTVSRGELVVVASRAPYNAVWHVDCFVCCVCRQQLVDLVYFHSGGHVYCGRHHAETLKPRCPACDELIFSDECTQAGSQCFHIEHFTCCDCRVPLAGHNYVLTEMRVAEQSPLGGGSSTSRLPLCWSCYHQFHADHCTGCRGVIAVGQQHVVYAQNKWHADANCFRCQSCRSALIGRAFLLDAAGHVFCSAGCGGKWTQDVASSAQLKNLNSNLNKKSLNNQQQRTASIYYQLIKPLNSLVSN